MKPMLPLSAVGAASLIAAQLWHPRFGRELVVCGFIALLIAAIQLVREQVQRP